MSIQGHIRPADRSDVEKMVYLSHEGGIDNGPKKILRYPLPAGYFEAFERIKADKNHQLMVVEHQGQVIATFHVVYLTFLAGGGREDCQIESVYVDAVWRGKGIGTRMMQWVINEAKVRGCRRVQLTTHKMRKDAHRFYERLGFALSHEGAKLNLLERK